MKVAGTLGKIFTASKPEYKIDCILSYMMLVVEPGQFPNEAGKVSCAETKICYRPDVINVGQHL